MLPAEDVSQTCKTPATRVLIGKSLKSTWQPICISEMSAPKHASGPLVNWSSTVRLKGHVCKLFIKQNIGLIEE